MHIPNVPHAFARAHIMWANNDNYIYKKLHKPLQEHTRRATPPWSFHRGKTHMQLPHNTVDSFSNQNQLLHATAPHTMADLDNDANYKPCLIAFMNWRDEADYENDHEFTAAELGAVSADEVVSYFNLRAYNTETSGREDRPLYMRSNSLLYYKKALS